MARVLYIAGTSYCGSTLLSLLLDAHPQIASVGEATGPAPPWDNADYPCSCQAPIVRCPFWANVAERMRDAGIDFDPARFAMRFDVGPRVVARSLHSNLLDRARDALIAPSPWGRRLHSLARRYLALVDAALATTGAEVFADASKDPVRAARLADWTDLGVRIVHLVRDPRGQVASALKHGEGPLAAACRRWNRSAAHVDRLVRRVGAQHAIRVRYEDLCNDPAGQLDRIAELAGVGPFARPIRLPDEHHIIGNRMRLENADSIRPDESWRQRLSEAEADEILCRTTTWRSRLKSR